MTQREKITRAFKAIKAKGFIASNRSHNTGIGKTFEDHLGVLENNKKEPDFEGFEVKTQREASSSFVTLFTKSPTSPKGANSVLRENFGKPDKTLIDSLVLHTSCYGDKFNTFENRLGFRLRVDHDCERVSLLVKDLATKKIVSENVYWSFQDLMDCIERKLRALIVVTADAKKVDEREYFHYQAATIYLDLKFSTFIKAIESGDIMFDIRIGVYHSGKNIGRTHDHGSGFRVKRQQLPRLFRESFIVE